MAKTKQTLPARIKTVFSLATMGPIMYMFGWRHVGGKLSVATGPRDGDNTKEIGPDSALQIATVWACIRLIAETISTLPMLVYRTAADGGRTVAKDHPLYELLHDSPHFDFTAVEFWEGVAASLCIAGNAYAEKLYFTPRSAANPNPKIVALDPLPADQVEVFRTPSGARRYRFNESGKRVREIAEEDMFHVRGFGNGGDVGLSPVSYARQTLYAARMASKAAAGLFEANMRYQGVLEMDQSMDATQRAQARENILEPILAGGSGILEHGIKFKQLSMSAQDAQMLETMSFQIEEICRWFRVPPFMIGHTQKSTSWGTGLEQQNIGFLTYSLRPYLSRIEQTIRRSLMTPVERKSLTAEFKVEGLLRADSTSRASFYKAALGNTQEPGWMVKNEVRRLENLSPLEGGDLPPLLITAAGAQTAAAPQGEPNPPAPPEDDEE